MKTGLSHLFQKTLLRGLEKGPWQRADGSWWQTNPKGGEAIPYVPGGEGGGKDKPEAKPEEKPTEPPASPKAKVGASPIASEPATSPYGGHEPHTPDPSHDGDGDGVTDAGRVGVAGKHVPPEPALPRLPNLTQDERDVEERFCALVESDPEGAAAEYLDALKKGEVGDAPNIFNTDDVKLLSPDYNPKGKPDDEIKDAMSRYNVAVHQAANAIAKRAFLRHLDTLKDASPDKKTVLVTSGGVAAGKGFAVSSVSEASDVAKKVGAVWDAAGEQNGTENPWVLEECEKRGIRPVFVFVHADPKETWENPKRGVVERAGKKGRMVDARLHAESYVQGAKNFKSFMEKNKDKADFIVIDNSAGAPKRVDAIPDEALKWNADEIYQRSTKVVEEKKDLKPAVRRGATIGQRIWA